MTREELRKRFYWVIGDNPDSPLLVSPTIVNDLLNDGLRSLVDSVFIVKTTSGLTPSASGEVTLPSDFARMVKLTYGGVELNPIEDVRQAAVGSGETTQYIFTELGKVQLYDTPTTPYQTLTLTYRAYPPSMLIDSDIPSGVPSEYHEALATVYAKSEYARRMGYMSQYAMLREMWEAIKREISGVVDARVKPPPYQDGWRW